jgi:hypothetical protein
VKKIGKHGFDLVVNCKYSRFIVAARPVVMVADAVGFGPVVNVLHAKSLLAETKSSDAVENI